MIAAIKSYISEPWIGPVLGVLGLLAAYYFYRKSQRRLSLGYQRSEIAIVGGGSTTFPSDLQILFGERVVPRVTSTRLILWNNGNETIQGSQILAADPLRVETSQGEVILQAKVIKRTRAVNNVTLATDPDSGRIANLTFEYLDPGDGATLEVLHTDSRKKLSMCGTIKGIPLGVADLGPPMIGAYESAREIYLRTTGRPLRTLLMGIFLVAFGFVYPSLWILLGNGATRSQEGGVAFMLMGLFLIGVAVWFLWRTRLFPITLAMPPDADHRSNGDAVVESQS